MRRFQATTLAELLIMMTLALVIMLVVASLLLKSCSNDNSEALKALETNGFTGNTILDSGMWGNFHGCSKDDSMWYKASSTNPVGKHVNVIVCCGGPLSFKGCTIRTK